MTTSSKAALLEWLKGGDRMLGNDCLFAIDKIKADGLLTQEYIRRFNTDAYLPPVSGETPPDNGYKVFMKHFILDHPRLSFDNVDITSSRASLRMKIVAGSQVGLKQSGATWYPQRIDEIGPLVGPELRLRLELSEVPGSVDSGGAVTLDLQRTDDFVLTFSSSRRIQELGGDFFKTLFRALPSEKRVWSLGHIEAGRDELLRPASFELRTQRNPAAVIAPMDAMEAPDTDGAIMGMIRMTGNSGDKIVLPGPGYPYLIPDSVDRYSATVMFTRNRVVLAALLRQMPRSVFKNLEFELSGVEGRSFTAVAVSGWMEVQGGEYSSHIIESDDDEYFEATLDFEVPVKRIPLAGLLVLRMTEDGVVTLQMSDQQTMIVQLVRFDERSRPQNLYWPPRIEGAWIYKFEIKLDAQWVASDTQGGTLVLQRFEFAVSEPGELGPPQRVDGQSPSPLDERVQPPARWRFASQVYLSVEYAFSELFRARSLGLVRANLAKDLSTSLSLSEVTQETINLNFGGAIFPIDQHLPREVVVFGTVDPRTTTFKVSPIEKVIAQGSRLLLDVMPAQTGIQWSAESIEGSTDEVGNFDGSTPGLYLAPAASGIAGDFTRVRITATAPGTGYSSSALITVVKNGLSVSPLMEVCQVGDAGVALKAGHVTDGELSWRILGSQPHGSLAHSTGGNTLYVPGPDLPTASFLVEEVEVSNSLTNERRSVCLVTQMTSKRPSDVLVDRQDHSQGRVWLSVSAGGQVGVSELSVVYGPGRIERDGEGKPFYQVVAADTAAFCVVRAFWEPMPGFPFNFEGFIVLPLPLGEHAAAYQALEDSAQRVLRS